MYVLSCQIPPAFADPQPAAGPLLRRCRTAEDHAFYIPSFKEDFYGTIIKEK